MMGLRLFLLFLLFVKAALGGNTITELPGYSGRLPFNLESGYIQVGEGEIHLFYLFAESQRSSSDPVLVWLRGGPGCSSLSSFFFEHGPVTFDHKYSWDGSLPTLVLNNYTWTKDFSIIYLDAPAGSGYSYSTTAGGWQSGDLVFAEQLDQFLRQWFDEHPTFVTNELYLGGSGYTGNQVPITIQHILDSNQKISPSLNIKGYILGNPGTDKYLDFNGRYTYANRLALISDELYERADSLCSGNFTDPPNESCKEAVDAMSDLVSNINGLQVIEPKCPGVTDDFTPESTKGNSARRFLKEKFEDYLKLESESSNAPKRWCRQYIHQLCSIWANDETVQQALYVSEVRRTYRWMTCNDSVINGSAYAPKVFSVVGYHKNFTKTDLRGLIFSGDHDWEIPYIATQKWIWWLDVPLVTNWSAWFVNNETAGYMRKFSNGIYSLTFATLKGGGHYPAEYKVEESFEMAKRWLVNNTIVET